MLLSAGESAFTDAHISGRNTQPRVPAGGDSPCLLPMSADPAPTLSEKKIWTSSVLGSRPVNPKTKL